MKKRSYFQQIFKCFLIFNVLIVIFISIFILLIYSGLIVYSSTPSIKYGFFLVVGGKISVGDLVIFENPRQDLIHEKKLLKKVTKVDGLYCYVNGRSADELSQITGVKGIDSFDSDYFGWIKISECTKVLDLKIINTFLN